MLQLDNIQKSFGPHRVYSIASLELQGGLYRLKGINGSGKSTFLRMLAGMLPFKGEILLNHAISIRKHPVQYRLHVNYSTAEPVYPSFITGNELVNFVTTIKKGDIKELTGIKESLGIDNYLMNPTGSYSSGMLKKLSLLLAFTGRPGWILLDEPFTTLDQASQASLIELIRQRHDKGTSFIITTHHDIETTLLPFNRTFLVKDKQITEVPVHA